ncbi:hypothetical protein PYCC9005_002271 [Savitreella phatthalungensis]
MRRASPGSSGSTPSSSKGCLSRQGLSWMMDILLAVNLFTGLAAADFADYLPGAAKKSAAAASSKAAASAASAATAAAAAAKASTAAAASAVRDAAGKVASNGQQQPFSVPLTFRQNLATFWDRHTIDEFYFECFIMVVLAGYIMSHFSGSAANDDAAKKHFQKVYRLLHEQFAQVGPATTGAPLLKDTQTRFISYASGRKNVESVHVDITTKPRHDLLVGYVFSSIYGLYFDQPSLVDRLELNFTLPRDNVPDGFVWAVVHKEVMRRLRLSDWDLQFTKTQDLPDKLPREFVCMNELAETNDRLLTADFVTAIQGAKDCLEYVVVSDQPVKQPNARAGDKSDELQATHASERTIRLSVLADKATTDQLSNLLSAVLALADTALPKTRITPNGKQRLISARNSTYNQLVAAAKQDAVEQKSSFSDWVTGGALSANANGRMTRKEQRDKEARERISNLSASEQKKALSKERERALRKQQSKQSKRG